MRLEDAAKNYAYGNTSNITVDTVLPTIDVGHDIATSSTYAVTPTVSGASTYQWSVISGPGGVSINSPTTANTSIQSDTAGESVIRLTVTSSAGNSAYDELYFRWLSPSTHQIFLTSTTYSGNLGGLNGADAICTARATAGGLSGTFKALLSTSTIAANSRVSIVSSVRRVDGQTVANNSADFWDGTAAVQMNMTELGTTVSDARPWTGSTSAGAFVTGKSCEDWTDETYAYNIGAQGYATNLTEWFASTLYDYYCDVSNHFYCLSSALSGVLFSAATSTSSSSAVDLTFAVPSGVNDFQTIEVRRASGATAPNCSGGTVVQTWSGGNPAGTTRTHTDTGTGGAAYSYTACVKNASNTLIRSYAMTNVTASEGASQHIAFISTIFTSASAIGGLAGADNRCQTLATAASLSGTYKAILSTSTVNAKDRITISGPVKNTNNETVATNQADFWDGTLAANIKYSETGALISSGAAVTGTTAAGVYSGFACSNWTAAGTATWGSHTTAAWIAFDNNWDCSMSNGPRVYCISQ